MWVSMCMYRVSGECCVPEPSGEGAWLVAVRSGVIYSYSYSLVLNCAPTEPTRSNSPPCRAQNWHHDTKSRHRACRRLWMERMRCARHVRTP